MPLLCYGGGMNRRSVLGLCLALAAFLPIPSTAAPAPRRPATALVRLQTSAGPILIEVDLARAPITAANFLAYVDQRRFDATTFYRVARTPSRPGNGLVQGGIRHRVARALAPIAHEPTTRTGLRHIDGTVSMARNAPGSAMGDFFITLGPAPFLDAGPGKPGYAAFGRVVDGMPVLRRILAAPTYPGGESRATIGQSIIDPIRILTVRRVR